MTSFTDLPEDVIHWVLAQNLPEKDVQPFLLCSATHAAAHRTLLSGRRLAVRCQESLVSLPRHYDFGLYCASTEDPTALKCTLDECIGTLTEKNQVIVRNASHINVNLLINDTCAVELLAKLRALANVLVHSCHKSVQFDVECAHWDPALTRRLLLLLQAFTDNHSLVVSLKLLTPLWFLPEFVEGFALLALDSINIKVKRVAGLESSLADHVRLKAHPSLRRFKLISDVSIPHLALLANHSPNMKYLELDLPLTLETRCVKERHFSRFQLLEELRLLQFLGCQLFGSVFGAMQMPRLQTLYACFEDALRDTAEFDFFGIAPSLRLVYVADKRGTVQKKKY